MEADSVESVEQLLQYALDVMLERSNDIESVREQHLDKLKLAMSNESKCQEIKKSPILKQLIIEIFNKSFTTEYQELFQRQNLESNRKGGNIHRVCQFFTGIEMPFREECRFSAVILDFVKKNDIQNTNMDEILAKLDIIEQCESCLISPKLLASSLFDVECKVNEAFRWSAIIPIKMEYQNNEIEPIKMRKEEKNSCCFQ